MGLMGSHRQTFGRLVVHTPFGTSVLELPWTFSTFDYPTLCHLLASQSDHDFQTAKVNGRTGNMVHTDRGDLSAPLIVDALGWRRVLGSGYQPPDAPLSRGLEVHPWGVGDEMELWIDRKYVPAGYGWSFPAGRRDPHRRRLLRPALPREGHDRDARRGPRARAGPLPGQLDPPPAARRHRRRRLLRGRLRRPLPAADRGGHPHRASTSGSRAAASCARWWRAASRSPPRWRATATSPNPTAGSSRRCWPPSAWSRACPRACCNRSISAMQAKRFVDWSFGHYLDIAPPEFAGAPRSAVVADQLDVVPVGV